MNELVPDRSDLILPAKQSRSRARQTRIIEAGLELLHQQKFEDITMEQLALRANCSVGTLYKRFRDKEALLRVLTAEAVRDTLQDLDTDLARALTKSDTLSVALWDIINFLVNLFRHREMLILAIFKRQFDDPQATAALMATRMAVVDTALAKILAMRPRGMTAADFSWRFRVGMQLVIGALINAIQNRPGPLMLEDDAIIDEFAEYLIARLSR